MTVLEVPAAGRVHVIGEAQLPTRYGHFTAIAFQAVGDAHEHLALVHGNVGTRDVLLRLHSECLTGDIIGSLKCDCGEQLDRSLTAIVQEGAGMVIYLRGHEGRGIGIGQKLRAYALQEQGLDTVQANVALGLPVDARDFSAPIAFLRDRGISSVRLMTNNPDKAKALTDGGIAVSGRVAMPATVTPHNHRYLATKAQTLGHAGLQAAGH